VLDAQYQQMLTDAKSLYADAEGCANTFARRQRAVLEKEQDL
jgi:hypothetical protein